MPLQWIPVQDIDNDIDLNYLENTQIIDTKEFRGTDKSNINNIEDIIFSKSRTLKRFVTQFKDAERKKKAEKVTRFIYDLDKSIDNMASQNGKKVLLWFGLLGIET